MAETANFGVALLSLIVAIIALIISKDGNRISRTIGIVLLIVAIVFGFIGFFALSSNDAKPTLITSSAPSSTTTAQPITTNTQQPTPEPATPTVTVAPITQMVFTVDARKPRNNTLIEIDKGQHITLEYLGGKWRGGTNPPWFDVGPEGDPQVQKCRNKDFPIPCEDVMVLIASVGEALTPCNQSLCEFDSPSDGYLWLGPNDDNVTDNHGSLDIRVSVR